MNIFVLDTDPIKAGQLHCNQHVCKMIVETAQLLCTARYYSYGIKSKSDMVLQKELFSRITEGFPRSEPYSVTHVNHPCNVWVRRSLGNFDWLMQLGKTLAGEFKVRYGHEHASEKIINWIDSKNKLKWLNQSMTPFVTVMPEYLQDMYGDDPVNAYREFYCYEKHFAKWPNGYKPEWFEIKQK